jgi:NitT/TauT family transport system substrate-binding protein
MPGATSEREPLHHNTKEVSPMRVWQFQLSQRRMAFLAAVLAGVSCLGLLLPGCGGGNTESGGPMQLKVAYIGLTCEPPIFVAQEKGYFKDEGLDVELVKTDWKGLRDGLGLGRFHANHTLIMYILKPIEAGLDVKMTGGIHTGCLRIQAVKNSDIKSVADLKGKKIGIPTTLGSPPHLYASRMVAVNGLDPKKDVEWVVYPPETSELALDQGRVDAIASAEPIGTILAIKDKVRAVTDQAVDERYRDEFCCAVVVNGKFAREHPKEAAAVTRALLKGARWVAENPTAAAKLAVEKKYLAASPEINAQAISKLNYLPGVTKCRQNLDQVALEMQKAGFLRPGTDPAALAAKAWMDLDGVTDEWIKGLKVEKIAGGGVPPPMTLAALNAILAHKPVCCEPGQGGCCNSEESLFPLPIDWAHVRPIRWNPAAQPAGGTTLVAKDR